MIHTKDKELLKKLLLGVVYLHGDRVNIRDMTNLLDDLVNSHDLFASFEEKEVNWNLEEDSKMRLESFLGISKKIFDQNDMINITFTPKCTGCEGDLKKKSNTNMEYVFNCENCQIDYWFKVTHGGDLVNSNIDE